MTTRSVLALLVFTIVSSGCRRVYEAPEQAGVKEERSSLAPVYGEALPADPLAERLCTVLHTLPAQRRARCQGQKNPGFLVTPECTRTLTAALAAKTVTLTVPAIERCEAAMEAAHESCDFTRTFGAPMPEACDGILGGTTARGDACRSSLECRPGDHCLGAGPMDPGVCSAPAPAGHLCGSAVDVLATHTRQRSSERVHPQCEGYCSRHRCTPFAAAGEACEASVQCGPGAACENSRCVRDRS